MGFTVTLLFLCCQFFILFFDYRNVYKCYNHYNGMDNEKAVYTVIRIYTADRDLLKKEFDKTKGFAEIVHILVDKYIRGKPTDAQTIN